MNFWRNVVSTQKLPASQVAIKVKLSKTGVANFFHVLQDTPELFHPLYDLALAIFNPKNFTLRQREIIILRIAGIRHSQYELFHHNTLALSSGLIQFEIDQIVNGDGLASREENILLETIDKLLKNEKFDNTEFLEHFDRHHLEYITAYIGFYVWLDTYTKALNLDIGQRTWEK